MKTPLGFAAIEQSMSAGCFMPGCTHDTHDEIFFHGRCHPRARVHAFACGSCRSVVKVCCAQPGCGKEIVQVEASGPLPEWEKCCRGYHDVRYVPGTGRVDVLCSQCERQLGTFQLAGTPEKEATT